MDLILDNEDILIEILCRLPAKTLSAFKCTSKRWNKFISGPHFQRIYAVFQQQRSPSGVFVQYWKKTEDLYTKHISTIDDIRRCHYIHLNKGPCKVQESTRCIKLEAIYLASCNGIICCRSIKKVMRKRPRNEQCALHETAGKQRRKWSKYLELAIYICNPTTRQRITLGLKEYNHLIDTLGFIFYPDGSRFKLVAVEQKDNYCSFDIYSSELGNWKMLMEICEFSSEIVPGKQIYVNGRLHWLAVNHHILTFDAEQESSEVIKLPGTPIDWSHTPFGCLGDSQGVLHYVCAYYYEVKIWILKDYSTPKWMLKCSLSLIEFFTEHPEICLDSIEEQFGSPHAHDSVSLVFIPLAFDNDVLFFKTGHSIFSYKLKNGKVKLLCVQPQLDISFRDPQIPLHYLLPYRPSVASLNSFKSADISQFNRCSQHYVVVGQMIPCTEVLYVKWKYPPYGWVKVNVGGGSVGVRGAGFGAVIRDCWGRWILGLSKYRERTSITDLIVGLSAFKEGLEQAWERGCRRVILETDSWEALDLVQRGCDADPESSPLAAHLVNHIKQLVDRSWQVKFNKVSIEENSWALELAKLGVGTFYKFWKLPPTELAVLALSRSS